MIVCTRTYVARVRFGIRVRVRDSGIFEKGGYRCSGTRQLKNYYLYFLYIFTIKIFLKNTLLCLDSPKKKKKNKASFGFFGRFRPISAVLAGGRYDPIWTIWPNFGRISPVWHESSRVGANQAESARIREKKKKTQMRTNAWATASDSASCVGPRLTRVRHLWCHVRAF